MHDLKNVHPALSWALSNRGFKQLTEVQKNVIKDEFIHPDLLVSAETGSGKTVAYGMNIMTSLLKDEEFNINNLNVLSLIVAPTRELALQIKNELTWLYEKTNTKISSCVGGMDMRSERNSLKNKPHIVVGTPGRLRDHIERDSLKINKINSIVLDEADEMLDLGFREDLEYILESSPINRRTLMFSATVPKNIEKLARRYQKNVIRLAVQNDNQQHKDIEYTGFTIAPNDRENAIVNILRFNHNKSAIIFCSTRATVRHLTSRLNNRSFDVVALSGELNQNDRNKALQSMRDGRSRICVATDVAARGIDLPELDLVIHADLPVNKQMLLHRSGRTGRAGRKGVSALLIPYNLKKRTERLFLNAKIKPVWANPPSIEDIKLRDQNNMLTHPFLNDPIDDSERKYIKTLLERFDHDQIATAFMRLYHSNLAAPEELIDFEKEPKKQDNKSFSNSILLSLSIGLKDNAAPKWIVAMLCRAGNITKSNIGKIEIKKEITFIQISSEIKNKFLKSIGPKLTIEDNIRVKILNEKSSDNKQLVKRRSIKREGSFKKRKLDNNKSNIKSFSEKQSFKHISKSKNSDKHISFKEFQKKEEKDTNINQNKKNKFKKSKKVNKKKIIKKNI